MRMALKCSKIGASLFVTLKGNKAISELYSCKKE